MGFSSRSGSAPAPISFNKPRRTSTSSSSASTPTSDEIMSRYFAEDFPLADRQNSDQTSSSGYKQPQRMMKKPTVNAHSYCGRHSTQFLFGGHTLGDLWRTMRHNK